MSTDATVIANPDESRFEVHTAAGRRVGLAEYVDRDGVRDFHHTEVDDEIRGRGLGGVLIHGALDRTRAEGLRVKATCPFVKAWIEEHAEYQDLLA